MTEQPPLGVFGSPVRAVQVPHTVTESDLHFQDPLGHAGEQPGTCTPFPNVKIWLILTRLRITHQVLSILCKATPHMLQ